MKASEHGSRHLKGTPRVLAVNRRIRLCSNFYNNEVRGKKGLKPEKQVGNGSHFFRTRPAI